MTAVHWASPIRHSTDAFFRAWGTEIASKMALVGLVQTADTGQINWTTVVRPGLGVVGGYEIWRFADSSLYMKFEYGTATLGVNEPQIWFTVGEGSNGSGTLTGQLSTRMTLMGALAIFDPNQASPSYMCHVSGAFSFVNKIDRGATNNSGSMLGICVGRTVDGSGALTNIGYSILYGDGTGAHRLQSVRTAAPAATYAPTAIFSSVYGSPTTSLVPTGEIQAYPIWCTMPQVLPFPWAIEYIKADAPKGTGIPAAMVGTVPKTYIAYGNIGVEGASGISAQSSTLYGLAFIFE